ncbi:Meiosis-specific nuclear structural protein [Melia azedarach]|uniref:Meiosis-specific nuclear structural protein n=1 Tax=Melia azedarach TaxID=155640 RepID=A0ACC1Z332_MELAZ|nr:Meiosis-specific nuclear structural protein [Melia azedarach]
MSVLQYPDTFNGQELQIWNNAAFDNGESEDPTAIKGSWSNLQSVYVNQSLESDCSKENLSPRFIKSPFSCLKSSAPIKPVQVNSSIKNSQMKPLKSVSIQGLLEKSGIGSTNGVEEEEGKRDEGKIDIEIEEVEKEICRLSSRLEALRMEKIDIKTKAIEKRGRFVPAKFMEQKQSFKNVDNMKKSDENLLSSAKSKLNRRGVSLGPAEIFSAAKSRPSFGKPEIITPVQSIQNRRKSCFWKLQEIDELKVTKERGKSSSVSPKSRKTVTSKIQPPKQAVTTVGSRKVVKKEDALLSLIQPRKLFRDGEKSVSKKPFKPGRMVASRYNQTTNDARKRSLPDNDKEESNRCDKRRASRENGANLGRNQKTETRVKKRWEIPNEVVVYKGSPPSISTMGDVLPKIRTVQCVDQSPRDSGAAKRVSELIGRKSFFCADDDEEEEEEEAEDGFVCQALSFDEDDFEEE